MVSDSNVRLVAGTSVSRFHEHGCPARNSSRIFLQEIEGKDREIVLPVGSHGRL
jgi:hypothetical protein